MNLEKDAEAAARFYAATFPNSAVTAVHKAPGDFPGGKEGDVLTVQRFVDGIAKELAQIAHVDADG